MAAETIPLSVQKDILPVLAAYQSDRLWGSVVIVFEDGRPTAIEMYEKVRWAEQVARWLRRMGRREPQ